MPFFNKRLDLNDSEFDCLKKYIDFESMKKAIKNFDYEYYKRFNIEKATEEELLEKLNNPKLIEISVKKTLASSKATEARSKQAREKIQNSINILRMENKKINYNSIATTSGVSFVTIKKYLNKETLFSLNNKE